MYVKRIAFIIALIAYFVLLPNGVTAVVDCSATFDQASRTIRGCIGGYSSPEDIKKLQTQFICVANSNTTSASGASLPLSQCRVKYDSCQHDQCSNPTERKWILGMCWSG